VQTDGRILLTFSRSVDRSAVESAFSISPNVDGTITAVNGQTVKSVEEFRALVEKSKDAVALLIRRGDATVFVPIEVG